MKLIMDKAREFNHLLIQSTIDGNKIELLCC